MRNCLFFFCLLLSCAVAHGQLGGGRGDGYAVGQLTGQQLNGSVVSVSVLYLGSSGDGYASNLRSSFTLQGSEFTYSGGSGDGFAANQTTALLSGMSVSALYTGGAADGFAADQTTALLSGINASALYAGGVADGFATDQVATLLSGMTVSALYIGGTADGFAADQTTTLLTGMSVSALYAGGAGDGFSALSSPTLLSGPLAGIYDGGAGDGHAALFITDLLSGGGSLAFVFGGGIGDGASVLLSATQLLNGTQLTMYNGGEGDGTANGTLAGILLQVPLPVELISFKAGTIDQVVLLTWSTATEINNDRFEVERSPDGIDFQKIDELIGAGSSTVRNEYQAFDLSPVIGDNYYRLKQVDFDGNHSNSEVRHVFYEKDDAHMSLKIYPNPNKDRILNLEIEGISQDIPAQLTIHTYDGQLLETREITAWTGIQLPWGWPAGQYLLRVESNTVKLSSRLIIVN